MHRTATLLALVAAALIGPVLIPASIASGQELDMAEFEAERRRLREEYTKATSAAEKRAILEKFRRLELKERGEPAPTDTRPSSPWGWARPVLTGVLVQLGTALAENGQLGPELAEAIIDFAVANGIDDIIRDRLRDLRDAMGDVGDNPRLDDLVGSGEEPTPGGGTDPDEPGTDEPDEPAVPEIVSPEDGNFLVGSEVDVKVKPRDATVEAIGPAEVGEGNKVLLTGVGKVELVAVKDGKRSEPVTIESVGVKVTQIVVEDSLPIVDAKPPHFQAAESEGEDDTVEPAAILMKKALTLKVTVEPEKPLSAKATATLVGTSGQHEVTGEAKFGTGNGGANVKVETEGELNKGVAVNELNFEWGVLVGDRRFDAGDKTEMRVYTTYGKSFKNNTWGQGGAVNTKLHYELACSWANGAGQNIGNGSDSIGWNVDNYMRHHTHPSDYKAGSEPFVPHYPEGAGKPVNYDKLPGSWQAKNGARGVSRLYYPPLEVRDPEIEDYSHYQRNYGWWLLDNPTHTGGRCNQQASLVANILGTLGIKATVHYLERTGIGKRTGRPVRNYFYASGGSGPWNFHGLCKATLADGTEWLYDGSFSSPPSRKNGLRDWAEAPGGPFLEKWGPWYYEDGGGKVPANDIPTTWKGIQ